MWIFLNDAFLSIIQPKPGEGGAGDELLVRARISGDIERVFPRARVTLTDNRDYRFRALVARDEVASAIAGQIRDIDYTNFKGSVREDARHDAYMEVWTVMYREQQRQAVPVRRGTPRRG